MDRKTSGMHPAVDADYATIGGLLLAPRQLDVLEAWLRPEDFARPLCGEIYEVIVAMRANSRAVDPVTVLGELRRDGRVRADGYPAGELIAMVEAVPSPAMTPHYARLVLEAATFRRIEQCGTRIAQLGRSHRGTPDDAFDTLTTTWRDLATTRERWQATHASMHASELPADRPRLVDGRVEETVSHTARAR
jgi:replicative DNA helicase